MKRRNGNKKHSRTLKENRIFIRNYFLRNYIKRWCKRCREHSQPELQFETPSFEGEPFYRIGLS